MSKIIINIARDFSPYPGGRTEDVGPNTGERFYNQFLKDSYCVGIKAGEKIDISLDGLKALPPSFISESFGILYKEFGGENIFNNIVFIGDNLFLVDLIKETSRKGNK